MTKTELQERVAELEEVLEEAMGIIGQALGVEDEENGDGAEGE